MKRALSDSTFASARRRVLAYASAAVLALAGCAVPPTPPPAAARSTGADTILVVGDSLSAGYGLQPGTGWVNLLAQRLAAEGRNARVINVSVSGETTVTGRSQIAGLVAQHRPTIVVIEMGADDVFGRLPLPTITSDLGYMVRTAQQAGARVLLVGVKIPSRYDPTLAHAFSSMYVAVAAATGAALVPDLLDRVQDAPDASVLFQRDNIHPNERAQSILLDNVWPELRKLLK